MAHRPLPTFSRWSVAVSNGPDTCRPEQRLGERLLPPSVNAYSVPQMAVAVYRKRPAKPSLGELDCSEAAIGELTQPTNCGHAAFPDCRHLNDRCTKRPADDLSELLGHNCRWLEALNHAATRCLPGSFEIPRWRSICDKHESNALCCCCCPFATDVSSS